MDGIAIYFSKLNLGYDRHVFKPVSVIRGFYDKESDQFQTDYGVLCESIYGDDYSANNFFGCPTTMEELKKHFGNNTSNQSLLDEYFSLCTEYCYIGYYDYMNCKIVTKQIPFDLIDDGCEKIFNVESDNHESLGMINFDLDGLKDIRDSKSLKEVQDKINNIISLLDDNSQSDKNFIETTFNNFEFELDITPYTILDIDEGEYSKKELMNAVKKRIVYIKGLTISHDWTQSEVDCILDAYNEIVSAKQKKKTL